MTTAADLYADYPHLIGLAPEAWKGSAAELLASEETAAFAVAAGLVAKAFHDHGSIIHVYFSAGTPILFLCETPTDRDAVRQRLASLAPPSWSLRE